MGIREKLNERPALTTGITLAMIVVVLIIIVIQLKPSSSAPSADKAWYSDDDGKSYYKAESPLVTPVNKGGKEQVRAYVYKCKGTDAFVGYLERFSVAARKRIEQAKAAGDPLDLAIEQVGEQGREVKRPGAKTWTNLLSDINNSHDQVTVVKCPDGGVDDLQPVLP